MSVCVHIHESKDTNADIHIHTYVCLYIYIYIVTQTLFGSRMNWIYDPAPPAPRRANVQSRDTHVNSRDPPVLTSDTQASAITICASSGAPLALPHPKKSRRRRRRRNRHSANENSAPRSATPVTPDERWANRNSVFQRATQYQSEASDPTQMMSTPVYQEQSFHSSHLPPPPIPVTNRNSAFQFGLDRCEFPGLYKPAFPDLRLSYPEERRFSQKLFSAVELLYILLCADFGIQAFIFHHTSEPRFLYVEEGQLVIRSSSFSTRASFSLC